MKRLFFFPLLVTLLLGAIQNSASAANNCTFSTSGSTMTLQGDCTTDASIMVPDGMTLNGNGYTLTAVDPSGNHFRGGVVRNGGASANVVNLTVTTLNLSNVCDAGDDRLRGILFDGASGKILDNTIVNLNQGASGCQEGNAIEVRNFGANPNRLQVEISGNTLSNYQKSGIVVNGDADGDIHHNTVGASATQANLAANSVQVGFGAKGNVTNNHVAGNSWCCVDAAATAILLFQAAPGTLVRHNNLMDGNADVGIYIEADGVSVDNNRVFESGPDGYYDVGLGDYGTGNAVTNNKVRGYSTSYEGVSSGNNKSIPSPHDQ